MDAQVAVFDTRFYEGFNGDEAELYRIPYGQQISLREALNIRWSSDAHMAMYSLPAETITPRLNKPCLHWFQTQMSTQSPCLTSVAVDVDIPGHGEVYNWYNVDAWPSELHHWYARVDHAMKAIDELQISGMHLTHGGMRFVWPLAEHRRIGVALADSYLRQFLAYLQSKGLPVDASCSQWNRLFRLPFVVRDGQPQNFGAHFEAMQALDWAPLEPLVDEGPGALGAAARTDLPDDFVEPPPPTRADLAPFKDKGFYTTLLTGIALADAGERHDTAMKTAATIVAVLDTNDPLVPYRMLLSSARAANFPLEELWNQCVWVCRVHDGSKRLQRQSRQTAAQDAATAMGCSIGEVPQRLILATRTMSTYYVYNEEKKTWDSPVSSTNLLANKVSTGCPTLLQIPPQAPAPRLLEHHGTVIDNIIVSYTRSRVEYVPTLGTVYEPVAPLDPRLRPSFDADIDQWLRLLFGSEVDRCLDWLATLTRLDRPTCALYLRADPDVGKGLLASGLARLWGSAPSKYEELIRDFQDGLTQCPLIYADETVPENPFNKNDSSVFRRAVGTGYQKIFIKHRPPATLEGFPRILITANNADALNMRDALEPADIEALQQRIGYVETSSEAGDFLKARAHARGVPVQDMVEPWISGGKIASHVLWLRDNRHVVIGDRFLVEGWPSALTNRMAIKFGVAPLLGSFIARVIRDRMRQIRGIVWGDGEVFVNIDYIRDAWQHVMGRTSRTPGDQTLMKALQVLSDGERIRMRARESENPRYFWRVDIERIEQIAEEFHLTDRETIRQAVMAPKHDADAGPESSSIIDLFAMQGTQ